MSKNSKIPKQYPHPRIHRPECFAEHLGAILKDETELRKRVRQGLSLARSDEDFEKFQTTLESVEKILECLKLDIGKRVSASLLNGSILSVMSRPDLAALVESSGECVENKLAVAPADRAESNSHLNDARAPESSEDVVKVADPQGTVVWSKKIEIPDFQRILLPDIVDIFETEAQLRTYFSAFGNVVGVDIFADGASAIIGFASFEVVRQILLKQTLIHNNHIFTAVVYSDPAHKLKRAHQRRLKAPLTSVPKQPKKSKMVYIRKPLPSRFQMQLTGMPRQTTPLDIVNVLRLHGEVRNVEKGFRANFAYVDMVDPEVVHRLLAGRFIWLSEKWVTCRLNDDTYFSDTFGTGKAATFPGPVLPFPHFLAPAPVVPLILFPPLPRPAFRHPLVHSGPLPIFFG